MGDYTIQISIQQIYLELSQSIVQIPTKPTVCTAFWCQETERTWEEAHRDQDPGHVEVSGFHDSTGHFHWLEPTLQIRTHQILTDGAIDVSKLEAPLRHGDCTQRVCH